MSIPFALQDNEHIARHSILFYFCSMLFDSTNHPLRYLFIDFNSYFAAVEQLDEPALRGRPVMVIPIASEHSGAIAVSYEGKALGIRRGTGTQEARALCPDIAIRVARHDRYVAVHHLLMAEIGRHLPITRVFSVDECACRLDATETDPARALALARRIKRGIARNIGAPMRSSIGIAPSVLLAKIAAESHKPDGLTLVEASQLPGALAHLPIEDIPGVGPAMAVRLHRAGFDTFTSLWALAPKHARTLWGSVVGERFAYALKGYDILDEAPTEKRSIGHSRVLSAPWNRPDKARIVTRALILKAASRLRLNDLYAGRLSFYARLRPSGRVYHETALDIATQNSWQLLRALDALWAQALPQLCAAERIGTVSITLTALSPHKPQPDLFIPAERLARDRQEALLWSRIDRINRRYPKRAIALASQQAVDLNYLGVKIAFSRVPDDEEFMC
jgi:DNA polymerase IV